MRAKLLPALILLFFAVNALGQTDDLKAVVHRKVDYFDFRKVPGWEFDEFKKSLNGYDKSDVANAFIADLDVDRGSPDANNFRDHIVERLYAALDLPVRNVCEQLEKEKSPQRKMQLMQILPESTAPEVITTLVDQLNDKRICFQDRVDDDGGTGQPPGMRVCDEAFNILAGCLTKKRGSVPVYATTQARDKTIEQGLKKLKSDGLLKQ